MNVLCIIPSLAPTRNATIAHAAPRRVAALRCSCSQFISRAKTVLLLALPADAAAAAAAVVYAASSFALVMKLRKLQLLFHAPSARSPRPSHRRCRACSEWGITNPLISARYYVS